MICAAKARQAKYVGTLVNVVHHIILSLLLGADSELQRKPSVAWGSDEL